MHERCMHVRASPLSAKQAINERFLLAFLWTCERFCASCADIIIAFDRLACRPLRLLDENGHGFAAYN